MGPISNFIYYHCCLKNFESVAYLVFIFSEAFVLASRRVNNVDVCGICLPILL